MDITSIKVLSTVKLTVGKQEYEGLLMPQEGDYVVIKLSSGYNIGIHPKKITNVEVLEEPKASLKASGTPVSQDKTLPKVKILHTGGTIASKVDYTTGGVNATFDPAELIALFPELATLANIESEFLGNMWSDDFRFAHFNKIATKIFEGAKQGITKFIVGSGTDFLHYLSAALSFLLKDLPVSVLVVGSQRSSDRGSTDAAINLICATQFLTKTPFTGVGVCMHATQSDITCHIISGTHVRKMHSSRRDAFQAINDEPIATVNYQDKSILLHKELEYQKELSLPKEIFLFNEKLKIGMLYARPQLFEEELAVYDSFDGLLLVGSGLGQFPINMPNEDCDEHGQIFKTIELLAKKIPIAMSVQTISGRVHMNVYSPGRRLQDAGVIGHGSTMMPEVSYIKLAWLLSNYSADETRKLFTEDIVGELNYNESNKQ